MTQQVALSEGNPSIAALQVERKRHPRIEAAWRQIVLLDQTVKQFNTQKSELKEQRLELLKPVSNEIEQKENDKRLDVVEAKIAEAEKQFVRAGNRLASLHSTLPQIQTECNQQKVDLKTAQEELKGLRDQLVEVDHQIEVAVPALYDLLAKRKDQAYEFLCVKCTIEQHERELQSPTQVKIVEPALPGCVRKLQQDLMPSRMRDMIASSHLIPI